MTLINKNEICVEKDGSITAYYARVQGNSQCQFQMLNISFIENNGLVLTRDFFPIYETNFCEVFPFSAKTNQKVCAALASLKRKATVYVPESKCFKIPVKVPENGIILGGDSLPNNIVSLYPQKKGLDWAFNFGPSSEKETVLIGIDGMNGISARVHEEFITALRKAAGSKKSQDEICDEFLEMQEAAKLVKGR